MVKKKPRPIPKTVRKNPLTPRAVVGIGASAGGLEAVTTFLKHLSPKTGMAFIYIQHLDPTHKSLLTPILARLSPIPVEEARDGTRVLANHLYIRPASKNLSIKGGVLRLATHTREKGQLVSIDNFFRSLATDQKDKSIGIILSGNASDGVLGLEAIKAENGLTFAQDEASAKYPSMPRAAVESGAAESALSPSEIARELERLSRHPIPSDEVISTASMRLHSTESFKKDDHESLQKIYALLRTRMGVNFSNYKYPTLKRRIERRMVLQGTTTLAAYATHLEQHPADVEMLFRDLLIHVTEFFRDTESFAYLQKYVFPKIVKNHTPDKPVRMWSAGCSTGEEAYSLAIAFVEFLEKTKQNMRLQIFGSDLVETNIAVARSGIYPLTIATSVSPERLQRFFIKTDDHYQIKKEIRDLCVFTKQNLLQDPPFSQLDLITCRNVLIYLQPAAQKHILPLFHYALNATGFLMLGKSESVGEHNSLFRDAYKIHKIYSKNASAKNAHLQTFLRLETHTLPLRERREQNINQKIDGLQREIAEMRDAFDPRVRKMRAHHSSSKQIDGVLSFNEELQSTNEELQSTNEELQSTNEELETTKEELQSTNEELVILNDELQSRNIELIRVNDDFTNVLSATNVPMIIVDRTLCIRRFTPSAGKSLHIVSADIGTSITAIKLPIRFPNLSTLLTEVIETAQARHQEVEDETGRWFTLWMRPYMTLSNKIDGAVITFIDINDIKRAQIDIEHSFSYAQGILETMREPLVVLDKNLRVKSANSAFYKLFPLTPEDTEGKSFYTLKNNSWDTPKLREALETILPEQSSFQDLEIEFNFPTLGPKIMCFNGQRLIQSERSEGLILLTIQDITERVLLQKQNENFISTASHELKTPVTTLKTLVQILQKRFQKSEDKTLVDYLTRMDNQIDQLTRLVVDFLDVAKIKANKFEMEEKMFDLDLLAREIVQNCQLLSPKHRISIHGTTSSVIKGDRNAISRVLINMIVNAIKYSPKATEVSITLSHTDKDAIIEVQDFGIGIAKAYQEKIFERFFQIGDDNGQNFSGLGIGLYISGAIVAQHNGHLSVTSKKGAGSTFSLTLPIQKRV